MPWVPHGLRNGTLTSRWPKRADDYFDSFPGSIQINQDAVQLGDSRPVEAAAQCPTDAIWVTEDTIYLDRGRCILCGRCTAIAPEIFQRRSGADIATLSRQQLVVGDVQDTPAALHALKDALAARVRQLRRSVHIRHVDAGSDGSDEWEVQALVNPVYDIHRLGIFFTASPRHADILLVTGVGTAGMREPLRQTRRGMPDPVVVIAAGASAISGGLIGGGYVNGTGIDPITEVDIWIPGSPASPFSLLHGILLALGRVPDTASAQRGDGGQPSEGTRSHA
jgi:Ni,Fe-hydrogenase III small subunit/ferredoxin